MNTLQRWAYDAVSIPLAYAQRGTTLAHVALAGAAHFEELRHYPERDVVDTQHNTRFFYHAHDGQRWGNEAPTEHGHFHLFWEDSKAGPVHIVALSLDARGQPLRWFATNRWVTGGAWWPAKKLVARLPRFRITRAGGRLAPLASWLTAMVQLFADELAALLRARDAALQAACRTQPRSTAWQDRSLDVLAHCDAALAPRLQRLGLA
ncbi:MAG: DUF6969 family protein [Tepidimonas sp.]|uniref:DUF6969 family protein n=1 Tax=Tepidimonas sp. TaxID=2002775 RepID=UPI004054A9D5